MSAKRIERIDKLHRQRVRSLQAVDQAVAELVNELQAAGELDDTYIFFMSDNGWLTGQHGLEGKGLPYEESIRVPLLVRGPGIAGGRTVDELALNIDLAPTFAELAGAPTPDFVDGRSLVPLLEGGDGGGWRQAVLIEDFDRKRRRPNNDAPEESEVGVTGIPGSVPPPAYAAIRTEDRYYVEYVDGERELYDMETDPDQLHNLVGLGRDDPQELAFLASWLDRLRRCKADDCRAAENGPPGEPSDPRHGDGEDEPSDPRTGSRATDRDRGAAPADERSRNDQPPRGRGAREPQGR